MVASQTEVESILVRMLGDGSSFQKMMSQAEASAKETAGKVQTHAKAIEAISDSLQGYATRVMGVLGVFGVASSLTGALQSAMKMEDAMLRLKGAIEANGRASTGAIARYKEFASEMRQTTTVTKDAVYSMLQHAEAMGVEGKNAEKAVKDATAMAAARGGEASSYLRVAVSMQKGETFMLRRLLHMHHVTDDSLLMAKAQEVVNAGMKIEAERAQSLSARMDRLGDALKGVTRSIGESLARGITPVVGMLERLAAGFQALSPMAQGLITALVGLTLAAVPLKMGFGSIVTYLVATGGIFASAGSAAIKYASTLTIVGVAQGVATASTWLLGAALVAVSLIFVAYASGLLAARKGLLEATKASDDLLEKLLDIKKSKTDETLKKAGGIEDLQTRGEFLKKEMAKANKDVADYENHIAGTAKKLADLQAAGPGGFIKFMATGGASAQEFANEIKRLKKELEENTKLKDNATEAAKKFAEALKLMDPSDEFKSKIGRITDRMKEQLATFGMVGDKVAIFKAKMEALKKLDVSFKLGVMSKEDYETKKKAIEAGAREAEALADLTRAQKEILEPIRKANEHMTVQILTFGMAAHEAEVYKLALKGATPKETERMAWKGIALDIEKLAETLGKKGKDMTKEFWTPAEKMEDTVKNLNDLFTVGAIGPDTYAKALFKAEASAQKIADHINHAVKASGPDAFQALTEYARTIKPGVGVAMPDRDLSPEGRLKALNDIRIREDEKKKTGELATLISIRTLLERYLEKDKKTLDVRPTEVIDEGGGGASW